MNKIRDFLTMTKLLKTVFYGRFCKRVFVLFLVFAVSFYVTIFFVGDFKSPRVMFLTDLGHCPACYGITVCPEMYSNQILLEDQKWHHMLFNAKNIYHGYTRSKRKVILKKLAHNWELSNFDSKLCKRWNLKRDCKPMDILHSKNIDKKIEQLVYYNLTVPELKPRKGLIFCPYPFGIHDFLKPALNSKINSTNYVSDLINIWTMLMINPEPLVLQAIPKSKGWRVPAYGGVCGRLEVVANEGEPLSLLQNIAWRRKLTIAKHMLDAAMDFTYKHDRFRFYLMDWSMDNIVVNEKDEVTFVDLEDIIVLDKHISANSDLPDWYKRYARDDLEAANVFSIDNICKHHLSDHNIYSICHILGGNDDPFLFPVPVDFKQWPHLAVLLKKCLQNSDRFKMASQLQNYISEILDSEKTVGK